MLTIILGILKVIGILLLVVFCILLLVVLLLLFCPVRYRGLAEKEEDKKAEARVDVTWLLHLLHITVVVKDAGPVLSFRILGISSESLGRLKDRFLRREKSAEKKPTDNPTNELTDKSADSQKEDEDTSAVNKANREKTCDSPVSEGHTTAADKNKTDKKADTVKTDTANTDIPHSAVPQENTEKKPQNRIRILGNRIAAFLKKVLQMPARLRDGAEKGIRIGKQTKEKLSSLKAFVTAQEFREALLLALQKAMRLIRHILPGRITGKVVFGLQDPADTGMVLAVVSPFFPVYGEKIQVIPDFQEKRLDFSLTFRGRVYGCMLLYVALRLLLDHNVQIIIRKIRKKEV